MDRLSHLDLVKSAHPSLPVLTYIARWRQWESHAGSGGAGVDSMVTINHLTEIIMDFAGKRMRIKHISGPPGVGVRNCHIHFSREKVDW
jgi:hypothetical protein